MNQTESMINKIVRSQLSKINISVPARVVGVQELKDGFIDVQPLVNFVNDITRDSHEESVIRRVRVVFPSTTTSTICFPVNQGDEVDLVFQSVNIEKFVDGTNVPHNPTFKSYNNRSDVCAYIGFENYKKSCFNANNYSTDFDNQDLNIVHNKKTPSEVSIKLTQSGEVIIRSSSSVKVEAPEATLDCQVVDAKNAIVKTTGDVEIKGLSVYRNMTQHLHPYTDNGKPMVTSAPIPVG